ncbi:MAG: hypothetical protein ACREIC_33395, partial [Limisphaerales bacterium]
MKIIRITAASLCMAACIATGLILSIHLLASPAVQEVDPQEASDLAALARIEPIDTHAHVFVDSPAYYRMMKDLNLRIVDICVYSTRNEPPDRTQAAQFRETMMVRRGSHGRAGVCTTFNPYTFEDKNFARNAINILNFNFRAGAIAVKIWKNIGMGIRSKSGEYLMPDNPVFTPIFAAIQKAGKTLIA